MLKFVDKESGKTVMEMKDSGDLKVLSEELKAKGIKEQGSTKE